MTNPVTHTAPGKLLIAGEYAVLEPGQPAIVVAVDRFVTVRASTPRQGDVVLDTDLLPHEVALVRDRTGLRPPDPADTPHLTGALAHLVSAVEIVDRLRAGLALPPVPLRLTVRSGLHEHGVKIGLGSSGAVTVAAVAALTAFHAMPTTPELRFRLALLASIRVDAGPSGADLAASTWGGWISYRAPDRALLLRRLRRDGPAETLRATWPELTVRALPPPNTLSLHTGWSGSPASTSAHVHRLSHTAWRHGPAFRQFLARSATCVDAAAHALGHDDPGALLDAVRDAHHLLADLDDATGLGIFTPRLSELCAAAQTCGGAAKPSGAGGGDCGIAL
ncbi:phosphomevalonate kinase, partial [Streptomyces sp. SID3343]|uniref:phosphomevalonate kinase n=1 Tax=Streptomyces sp. SID3343 TaxID=2690260 RepID=UPI00136E30D6